MARVPSRSVAVLLSLLGVLCVGFVLSLVVGSTSIPWRRVVDILWSGGPASDGATLVVESVRLPRSLTAMFAGASLGVAGLQMQTLFRNPLADPFVLGVSSGASLGVALVVLGTGQGAATAFGTALGLRGDAVMIGAATAGALMVLGLVLLVSLRVSSQTTVLILGVMFGYAVAAVVTVLVAASTPERLQQWAQWGFGSFSGVTSTGLWLFGALTCAGVAIAAATTTPLNVLLLGDTYARSMGLAVGRLRFLTMVGASVLAAVVTAFCGPIAFLGMAVPHVCRGLLGTSDHRVLLWAVVMAGAVAALLTQMLAVLPGPAGVLPINAVTALLGAPIVVVVLLRGCRRGEGAP